MNGACLPYFMGENQHLNNKHCLLEILNQLTSKSVRDTKWCLPDIKKNNHCLMSFNLSFLFPSLSL